MTKNTMSHWERVCDDCQWRQKRCKNMRHTRFERITFRNHRRMFKANLELMLESDALPLRQRPICWRKKFHHSSISLRAQQAHLNLG